MKKQQRQPELSAYVCVCTDQGEKQNDIDQATLNTTNDPDQLGLLHTLRDVYWSVSKDGDSETFEAVSILQLAL